MKKAWCLSNALDNDNRSPAMTALRTSENGSRLYRFNTLTFGIFPEKNKSGMSESYTFSFNEFTLYFQFF